MDGKTGSEYSIQIMLPEEVDRRMREWVDRTPGATWPDWGGHITLINRFSTMCSIKIIQREVSDVTRAFSPFTLRLNHVVRSDHWNRPDLQLVLLTSETTQDEGYRTLARLHDTLTATLGSLRKDLMPEVSQRPFAPHISLTWGLANAEAIRLAKRAVDDGLMAEFAVSRIHMLEFKEPASGQGESRVCNQTMFVLGQGLPLEETT